jgi:hypothetical protein
MLVAENGGCMTVRAGTGPAVKGKRKAAGSERYHNRINTLLARIAR